MNEKRFAGCTSGDVVTRSLISKREVRIRSTVHHLQSHSSVPKGIRQLRPWEKDGLES